MVSPFLLVVPSVLVFMYFELFFKFIQMWDSCFLGDFILQRYVKLLFILIIFHALKTISLILM